MDLVGSGVEDVSAAIAQSFWTKRGGSKTLCPDGTRNFVKEPLGIEIEWLRGAVAMALNR